jgi:hypothetical protein
VALVAAAAVAGCGGGGGNAKDVLADTAVKLGKIRSGVLYAELVVTPRGMGRGPSGFRLDGPFSLGPDGSPDELRIAYKELGAARPTATVIAAGGRGYVETEGKTYELGFAQAAALRAVTRQLRSSGALARLSVEDWIRDPELSNGGRVGGADTDRIVARFDVDRAAEEVVSLVRGAGEQYPELRDVDADELADAVQSSSFELFTGKRDRLLRRVRIEADLSLGGPRELRSVLGSLVGAKVKFVLGVDHPNSAIHVSPPAHPLPASQRPSGF